MHACPLVYEVTARWTRASIYVLLPVTRGRDATLLLRSAGTKPIIGRPQETIFESLRLPSNIVALAFD